MNLQPPAILPTLRKPARLRQGDTLTVVAPSSPPDTHDLFEKIRLRLSQLGYQVVIAPHATDRLGFLAGSDSDRIRDLNESFASLNSRAVVSVRGGYGCGRILQSINFKELQKHPKIVIGSSDLCGILNGVLLHAGCHTFHGPTMQSLLEDSTPDFTWNSWIQNLTGDTNALGSIKRGYPDEHASIESLHGGRVSGRLLGGNLAVLLSLLGTHYFPSLDDSILFLEDVGESPFRVDRNLTHLLNIGALSKVRGFALGIFERCSYRPEEVAKKQSLRDVVIDRLRPLGKPIVLGLPFGHTRYNATLPIGATATLDGDNGDLIIEELGVQ